MSTNQDKDQLVKDHFSKLFEMFEGNLNGKSKLNLHHYRKSAIDQLASLGFPTRRDEDWKYTSVTKIIQPKYQIGTSFELDSKQVSKLEIQEADTYRLHFHNGVLYREHSDLDHLQEGLSILKLDEACQDERFSSMLTPYLDELSKNNKDPFIALNTAFSYNGIFIHIEKGTIVDKPIHLIYSSSSGDEISAITAPQLFVYAEKNSDAKIIEQFNGIGDSQQPHFTNVVNRLIIKENAHLQLFKLQNESLNTYLVSNIDADQYRDSTFTTFSLDLGGQIVRNNLSIHLKDSNTMSNMFGIYIPNGEQHMDNQTFIDHAFPHCESHELYKGIINDKGRGVFNGKVLVRQDAQKTNAFQQNSSLVLSDKAVMDSKPQLEIFADDVRCSHGATIGQLDDTSIYYLKARGLSELQAKTLLQFAFVGEVIDKIDHDAIKAHVEKLVNEKWSSAEK